MCVVDKDIEKIKTHHYNELVRSSRFPTQESQVSVYREDLSGDIMSICRELCLMIAE